MIAGKEGEAFHHGRFSLNGQGHYPGYARASESWNGFAVPYFEKATADRILADLSDVLGDARYLPKDDCYIYSLTQVSEPCGERGVRIQTDEGPKTGYCIGGAAWVWEEDRQEEEQ